MRIRLLAALAAFSFSLTMAHATTYFIPTYYTVVIPKPAVTVGSYEAIHKVAVISALGSKFTIPSRSSKAPPVDITPWRVDAEVDALLKKYLGGRFNFVDFAPDTDAAGRISSNFLGETKTRAYLKTLTNPGVDAYFVVRPVGGDLPGPDGLGIRETDDGGPLLWANFKLDIYDARTFALIATADARLQTRDDQKPLYPSLRIYGVTQDHIDNVFTGDDMATLQRHVNDLLPRAMVETLRVLEFGVTLPPVGDHSISEPATAYGYRNTKKVAVLSAVGDSFRLVQGGHMFVHKTDVNLPSASWGMDAMIEQTIRTSLDSRYTVVPGPFDRTALEKIRLHANKLLPSELPGLTTSPDIDAYILVLKVGPDDYWTGDPQGGLGLMHWIPAGEEFTVVYARYALVVIDAKTLKINRAFAGFTPTRKLCPRVETAFILNGLAPHCGLDNAQAPSPPESLNEQMLALVQEKLKLILAASVPETLFRIGFQTVPAPK